MASATSVLPPRHGVLEPRIPDLQPGDDILAIADLVQDDRVECPPIEPDRFSTAINPQLRLDGLGTEQCRSHTSSPARVTPPPAARGLRPMRMRYALPDRTGPADRGRFLAARTPPGFTGAMRLIMGAFAPRRSTGGERDRSVR